MIKLLSKWFNTQVAREEYEEGLKRIQTIEEVYKDRVDAYDRFVSSFYNFYWKFNRYGDFYKDRGKLLDDISKYFFDKKHEIALKIKEIDYLIEQLRNQVTSYEKWKREQEESIATLQKYYKESAEAMNKTAEFLHNQQKEEVDKLNNALKVREETGRQMAQFEMINYLVNYFDMDRDELIQALMSDSNEKI